MPEADDTNPMDDRDEEFLDPEEQKAAEAFNRIMSAVQTNADPTPELLADIEMVKRAYERFPESPLSLEEKHVQDHIKEIVNDDLKQCAQKLQQLLKTLPPPFASLSHFKDIPLVTNDIKQYFLDMEDVKEMGKHGLFFAARGMRPAFLMSTFWNMRCLFDRTLRNPDSPHLRSDGTVHIPFVLSQFTVRDPSINPEAFEPLHQWFIDLLREHPHLVEGYTTEITETHIIARSIE